MGWPCAPGLRLSVCVIRENSGIASRVCPDLGDARGLPAGLRWRLRRAFDFILTWGLKLSVWGVGVWCVVCGVWCVMGLALLVCAGLWKNIASLAQGLDH